MATPPALRHGLQIDRIWAGRLRGRAVVFIKKVSGTNTWSQHSYGNATDRSGPRADMAALAAWAAKTANLWSVATVIYNRRVWSSRTRRWSAYGGDNPHTSHVHIDYLPRQTGAPPGRPTATTSGEVRTYPAIPRGARGLDVAVTAAWTWGRLQRVSLRRGSRGGAVTALQTLLRQSGFLPTSGIDGIFGPITQSAVVRIQTAARLAITGKVGGADWRALYWGPQAWVEPDIGNIGGSGWLVPPARQPTGELEHSWESTLTALTPIVGRAANDASWYARAIKDTTR